MSFPKGGKKGLLRRFYDMKKGHFYGVKNELGKAFRASPYSLPRGYCKGLLRRFYIVKRGFFCATMCAWQGFRGAPHILPRGLKGAIFALQ